MATTEQMDQFIQAATDNKQYFQNIRDEIAAERAINNASVQQNIDDLNTAKANIAADEAATTTSRGNVEANEAAVATSKANVDANEAVINSAIADINTAIEVERAVYVDAVAGNDANPGGISDPKKTVVNALQTYGRRNRFLRIHLHAGQEHVIDQNVHITSQFLEFYPWNHSGSTPAVRANSGDTKATIQLDRPTLKNTALGVEGDPYVGGAITYGISLARNGTIYFNGIVIETPLVPTGWEGALNSGLLIRSDYPATNDVILNSCAFYLASPLIHMASGIGSVNTQFYSAYFDLSGFKANFTSGSVIVNEGGKPGTHYTTSIYQGALPAGVTTWKSRMFSDRRFSTADPDENPHNLATNTSFTRAVAP